MSKHGSKVSVTIKGPLGAQKEKRNEKKIKSIESPRKKVPKVSRQMEPKRILYAPSIPKDIKKAPKKPQVQKPDKHRRTPIPHPNGKPKGSEGLAQPDRRHFSAQQKALNSAHEPKRIPKIVPNHYRPHRSSPSPCAPHSPEC